MMWLLNALLCYLNPTGLAMGDTQSTNCPSNDIPTDLQLPVCGTCANKCGEPELSSMLCSCDRLCPFYRDCCSDFRAECPELFEEYVLMTQNVGTPKLSCERLYMRNADSVVLKTFNMVSYCQPSESPCEFDLFSPEAIIQYGSPILDIYTGLYFVNSACAACNGIPSQSTLALQTTLGCVEEDVDMPEPGDHLLLESATELPPPKANVVLQEFIENRNCRVSFVFPSAPRRCIDSVHSCPESCAETNLTRLCRDSGQGYVIVENNVYNNIYCALCNKGTAVNCRCGAYGLSSIITLGSFSLVLLFDINDAKSPHVSSLTVECRAWIMIPIKGVKCQTTICSAGYVYDGGSCVRHGIMDIVTEVTFTYFVEVVYTRHCQTQLYMPPSSVQKCIIRKLGDVLLKQLDISDPSIGISVQHKCNVMSNYTIQGNLSLPSTRQHENAKRNVRYQLSTALTHCVIGFFQNESSAINSVTIVSGNTSQMYADTWFRVCMGPKLTCNLSEATVTNLNVSDRNGWLHTGNSKITTGHLDYCFEDIFSSSIPTVSSGLGLATVVVTLLSLFCLGCRILLQLLYPPYRTAPYQLHCCLACNLVISNLLLLLSPSSVRIYLLCYAMGIAKYVTYLNSFSLMICISWDNWNILRSSTVVMKRGHLATSVPKYLTISFPLPIIMSAVIIAMNYIDTETKYQPTIEGPVCWFTNKHAMYIYFGIPASICVVINFVLFALTLYALRCATRTANARISSKRANVIVCIKLFLLMGLTSVVMFFTMWSIPKLHGLYLWWEMDRKVSTYLFTSDREGQILQSKVLFMNWIWMYLRRLNILIKCMVHL